MLFKLRKRYRDVFGTVFILGHRLVCAGVVFLILYYGYSIVGMELFAEYDLKNCCQNTSVANNFAYYPDGNGTNGYYYLNNFENVISSYVTLFELTVINNWYILMEGYAATVNEWSRIYFMCFYLTIMMLLSIVVASVLDGFMFRISYKEQMSQEDEIRLVEKSVTLSAEEHEQLRTVEAAERKASRKSISKTADCFASWIRFSFSNKEEKVSGPFRTLEEAGIQVDSDSPTTLASVTSTVTFIGRRHRTKDVLLSFMFKEEITHWMEMADKEDKQQQQEQLANKTSNKTTRSSMRKRSARNNDPNFNSNH